MMVCKFIVLTFTLHLVVSLPNNATDVKVDRIDMLKEEADRSRIDSPTCKSIGGTCMSIAQINRNKCKGRVNANFYCNPARPNCCIERCPRGEGYMLITAPTQKCYKHFIPFGRVNWDQASQMCLNTGLVMPHPVDVIGLKSALTQQFGTSHFWLGAKGQGENSNYRWLDNSSDIPNDSLLWWPGNPNVPSGCLGMTTPNQKPYNPYGSLPCDEEVYTLCELVV